VTQFLIEKKIHVRNFQILICAWLTSSSILY
jgi:hypothetical protein